MYIYTIGTIYTYMGPGPVWAPCKSIWFLVCIYVPGYIYICVYISYIYIYIYKYAHISSTNDNLKCQRRFLETNQMCIRTHSMRRIRV